MKSSSLLPTLVFCFNIRVMKHKILFRRTGHSLLDMDSGSNGSRSRASSLEKEADSPLLSSGSGEDSDAVAGKKGRGSRGGSRGSKKKFTKKKSTPRVDGRLSKVLNILYFLFNFSFYTQL